MLNQLLNLVKEHAGDAIVNNPAIPNESNNEAITATAESLLNNLMSQAQGSGLENIVSLFQGGNAGNNSFINNITSNVAGDLMKKFGINNAVAQGIVSSLIPIVINKLVHKTNDQNDNSLNINNVISELSGGNNNILGTLTNLFGGK